MDNYTAGDDYNKLIFGIKEGLSGIDFTGDYINSLFEICEAYLSYVPSSTYLKEVSDISLYDHGKLTAAFATCIFLYLKDKGRENYKEELFFNSESFYKEKAFSMFSCDISGIQQFIYNITSKGALRALRARSFYLEVFLENLVDEILSAFSLYRTNLIYTGGGHTYMLLPNTQTVKNNIENIINEANNKLMKLFKDRLFIAYGLTECSAAELMNKTGSPEDYLQIFRKLASQISERKIRRYTPKQLKQLNENHVQDYERECSICGISENLSEWEDHTMICNNCASFSSISNLLIKKDAIFIVTDEKKEGVSLPLFDHAGKNLYLKSLDVNTAKDCLKNHPESIRRIYSKNEFRTGLTLSKRLWMGDYAAIDDTFQLKTFEELSQCSNGIDKIGVLRADVDNMGSAFVKGFVREELGGDKYRYNTLSRTATLSRSLSIFFKYYINDLLKPGKKGEIGIGRKKKYRNSLLGEMFGF